MVQPEFLLFFGAYFQQLKRINRTLPPYNISTSLIRISWKL